MHTRAPSSFSCLCLSPHVRLLGLQTQLPHLALREGSGGPARLLHECVCCLLSICFFIYDFNLRSYLTLLSDKLGSTNTVRVASPEDHTVDAMPAILLLCFSQFPTGEERLTLNHPAEEHRAHKTGHPSVDGGTSSLEPALVLLLWAFSSVAVFLLNPECLGPLIWGLREVGPLLSWISTSFSLRYCS